MVRGASRLTRDAVREVRLTFSRFLSILVLSALAVAFLAGLRTTAPDMQGTADRYFDRSRLMDVTVLSTLGLTEDDLAALAEADGVETVEGGWALDAIAVDQIVTVRSLPLSLNLLRLTEGRLPQRADECVTEPLLMQALGLSLGDRLELTLDSTQQGDLSRTAYTVVGVADSPLYAGPDRGSSSLGGGSVDAFLYIPGENFTYEVYTHAYLSGAGMSELNSYGDAYERALAELLDHLEPLAREREKLREQAVRDEAQTALGEAETELEEARAEVERELAQAREELAEGRTKLDEGWADYRAGLARLEQELADGRRALTDALAELEQGEAAYAAGLADWEQGLAQYRQGLADWERGQEELEQGEAAYQAGLAQYQQSLSQSAPLLEQVAEQQKQLDAGLEACQSALAQLEEAFGAGLLSEGDYLDRLTVLMEEKARLDGAQAQLDEALAPLRQAEQQLRESRAELDAGLARMEAGRQELEGVRQELERAEEELSAARIRLDEGWTAHRAGEAEWEQGERQGRQELADGLAELEQGERDYADGLADYQAGETEAERELAEGEDKLADARRELDERDSCQWYVLGRDTNYGFVSYGQDSDRISRLATLFPLIFFLVAALACLTTMTRMVEEQRTQIGALKALGFSRLAISQKYIGYAFFASLLGGVAGLLLGCTLIPMVIANAFNIMYHMPPVELLLQPWTYVLSLSAAVLSTTGAALGACLSTLVDSPANLMRPKAPKAGKRVLLEYVSPLWSRLSFIWKVTARNLFRYRRRFWMTVVGIGGCTALIVTGFGLHDSIYSILDRQFDEIFRYDATVGLDEDMSEEERLEILSYGAQSGAVSRQMSGFSCAVDCSAAGPAYSATLMLIRDRQELEGFLTLRHRLSDEPVQVDERSLVLTEKLSELLGVSVGDVITLQRDDIRVQGVVGDITEHYTSHYIYLTEPYYEALFGEKPADNMLLLDYASTSEEELDRLSRELMAMEGVLSYSEVATLREYFTDSMDSVNYAVVIVIVAAAALAFVVLYNLTNINITERMRELATLKVLGFFDREITAYVYRENLFLTLFGIAMGMGMGKLLHSFLVLTVEVDMVMFGRSAPPYAYGLAALLTMVFSVMVNVAAHFRLKQVDMVESLKSVE